MCRMPCRDDDLDIDHNVSGWSHYLYSLRDTRLTTATNDDDLNDT